MTVVAESSDAFLSEVNFLNTVEQTIWRVFFLFPALSLSVFPMCIQTWKCNTLC